jgi:hypothetical protein
MNVSAMNSGSKPAVQDSRHRSASATPQRVRGCLITIGVSWALMVAAVVGSSQFVSSGGSRNYLPVALAIAFLPVLPTLFALWAWLHPGRCRLLDIPARRLGGGDEARGSAAALLGVGLFFVAIGIGLSEPTVVLIGVAIPLSICFDNSSRWIKDPYHRMLCAMAFVACPLLPFLLGLVLAVVLTVVIVLPVLLLLLPGLISSAVRNS